MNKPLHPRIIPPLAGKPMAEGGGADGGDAMDGTTFLHGLIKSASGGRTDRIPINVPAGAYVMPADIVSGLAQGNTIGGAHVLDRVFSGMPYHEASGPYGSHQFSGGGSGSGPPPAPRAYSGNGPPDNIQPLNARVAAPPMLQTPGADASTAQPAQSASAPGKAPAAKGGAEKAPPGAKLVPIIAAGGEYVIHPVYVNHIGSEINGKKSDTPDQTKKNMKAGWKYLDNYVARTRNGTINTLKALPGPAKD